MSDILSLLIAGQIHLAKENLHSLFELFREHQMNPGFIKDYCCIFLFELNEYTQESSENPMEFEQYMIHIKKAIHNCYTINALEKKMKEVLTIGMQRIQSMQATNQSYYRSIVKQLESYIKEHYMEHISLNDLSAYVHLTPSYVSSLFKQIMGENYTDYLRRIRMDKAKEYLKGTTYKIYEVSTLVGYSDYKYFTSQFKNLFDISPTEYRKKYINDKKAHQ